MKKVSLRDNCFELLKKIPKGKVTTYKELGRALNCEGYRAIGQILKRNKNPEKILCFKVVKSDGSVGGYCGSSPKNIKKKIEKLREEGIEVKNDKIDFGKYLHRF